MQAYALDNFMMGPMKSRKLKVDANTIAAKRLKLKTRSFPSSPHGKFGYY